MTERPENKRLEVAYAKVDGMLDNAYRNFYNWKELRGFSGPELRRQFREFSQGELSLMTVNSWSSDSKRKKPKRGTRVFMHLVVILADMMSVNPIELISGTIDVRKL